MSAQALDALAVANRARMDAAQVLRELRAGTLTITDAVNDPRAGSLTVLRLLCGQHRWGRARALRVLRGVPVTETVRVRDLTERQRVAIGRLVNGSAVDCNPFPGGGDR